MRIALVLNDDFSMWHFRRGLIKALVKMGFFVSVIVPPGKYKVHLESLGAEVIQVPMERFIAPLHDIRLMYILYKIYKSKDFDIVHNMTIKPNIFGTIAARLAGVKKVVCLVSGAGFIFHENNAYVKKITQKFAIYLYRIGLTFSEKVWFQNTEDMEEFVKLGLLKRKKAIVIKSGGINVDEYSITKINKYSLDSLRYELNLSEDDHCIVMVAARMIWSKGVREFLDAAGSLKKKYRNWKFIMLTPKDENSPDAVELEYIERKRGDNVRVIDSFREDVDSFIAIADIVVLPSYYREGVPRTLLEALAFSKPIITTNRPGCKEVVQEGENGYLVEAKNVSDLVCRLERLMEKPDLREKYGRKSRNIAKTKFSEEVIVRKIINNLYGLSLT